MAREDDGEDAVRGDNSEQWSELPGLDDNDNDVFDIVDTIDENTVDDREEDDPMVTVDPTVLADRASGKEVEDEDADEDAEEVTWRYGLTDEEAREYEQELANEDGQVPASHGEEEGDLGEQWPEPPEINAEHDGYIYWVGWLASKYRIRYRDLTWHKQINVLKNQSPT